MQFWIKSLIIIEKIILATTIWPTPTDGLLSDGFNGEQMFKTFVIIGIVLVVVGIIFSLLFPNMRKNSTKKKHSSIFDDDDDDEEDDWDNDGTPDWRDDEPFDPFES